MDLGIIIIVLIIGFGVLVYLVSKKNKPSDELLQIIQMIQASSSEDRKVLMESLQRNTQSMNERLDNAARVIGDVQKNIGEMSEIGRSMRQLQDFLQSPKLRGNVGEQVLKELLGQMLPKGSFHLQYSFKSGEKVDAAIQTSAGIVPIDSKFPMENFRKMMGEGSEAEKKAFGREFERDVRKHIDSISKKYILTDEGTIDYALMYVPSEAVYYEVVNNGDLFDYAGEKRILPVSPTTFYAYMRAILMSFEGQKVEAKAKQVLSAIRAIQKDYEKVEDNLSVLQKHINNANNTMGTVLNTFGQLGQKVTSANSLESQEDKEKMLK